MPEPPARASRASDTYEALKHLREAVRTEIDAKRVHILTLGKAADCERFEARTIRQPGEAWSRMEHAILLERRARILASELLILEAEFERLSIQIELAAERVVHRSPDPALGSDDVGGDEEESTASPGSPPASER